MSNKLHASSELEIEVVYALAEAQQLVRLKLPPGTSAREALVQALETTSLVLNESDAQLSPAKLPIGVYGQQVDDSYEMQTGDRLEIYRPLLQDPKERRRQQAKQTSERKRS